MRILYTCQRYGEEILGGSESACRAFAEQLTQRGHDVHVLTTTAREYTTWANHYPPGLSVLNGVQVHRLHVRAERTPETFGPMQEWVVHGPKPMPLFQQQRWLELVGPSVEGLEEWLRVHTADFDVAIFMTYLYCTTTRGLPALAGRLPTILQPTAHDEPSIWATVFDTLLRLPDAYLYFTPSERAFMEHRLHRATDGAVIGIGIDQHEVADQSPFRLEHGLGDRPYLLYVGRVDGGKGTDEAARFFTAYQQRNPSELQLVMAGELIGTSQRHPGVVYTGFLDEAMKRSAMAGSLALLQPSYFESFSIVLCESWVQGRPALVQDGCAVLGSQVRRANGGLPYTGFASFEAALDLLRSDAELGDQFGASGQRFVRDTYSWPEVIDGVETTIDLAIARFAQRRHSASSLG